MLAVGAPFATTSSSIISGSTSPSLSTLLTSSVLSVNYSLDVPQGDQPGPPYNGAGSPPLPHYWTGSTKRYHYIKNRFGMYLEMLPDGNTRGSGEHNSFCIFVFMSHISYMVMHGYVSDKFLCMNSTTSQLYTRSDVHEDCYIQEAMRNGSDQLVYSFIRCRTSKNKQCYLGMYRNGTMRRGANARPSQDTAQWLKLAVNDTDKNDADVKKKQFAIDGWTSPPTSSPKPPVNRKEQRRKRVRRWCRNLSVIVKKPEKIRRRCKHDCDILERMIKEPERSMRKCLLNHLRRRIRNKATKNKKGPVEIDNQKLRATMQTLWPNREEIFRRLRLLRRCNKRRWRRGREGSCTNRDLRRMQRRRAKKRKQSKSTLSASGSSTAKPNSGSSPSRRIRHRGKNRGQKKKKSGEDDKLKNDKESEYQSKSILLTSR